MTGYLVESDLWACQPELASVPSVAYRTTVTRRAQRSGCLLLILPPLPTTRGSERPISPDLVQRLTSSEVGMVSAAKKHQRVQWGPSWSLCSNDLLALHEVWWHLMSNISLMLERQIKLEDTDPGGVHMS